MYTKIQPLLNLHSISGASKTTIIVKVVLYNQQTKAQAAANRCKKVRSIDHVPACDPSTSAFRVSRYVVIGHLSAWVGDHLQRAAQTCLRTYPHALKCWCHPSTISMLAYNILPLKAASIWLSLTCLGVAVVMHADCQRPRACKLASMCTAHSCCLWVPYVSHCLAWPWDWSCMLSHTFTAYLPLPLHTPS